MSKELFMVMLEIRGSAISSSISPTGDDDMVSFCAGYGCNVCPIEKECFELSSIVMPTISMETINEIKKESPEKFI